MNIPEVKPPGPLVTGSAYGAAAGRAAEALYRSVAGGNTIPGKMKELITRGSFQKQEAMATPLVDLSQFAPEDAPLIQGVAQSLAQFTSPEGVMMLAGTGALGRLAKGPFGRAVSLGFTVDMLDELPEQGAEFRKALAESRFDDAERVLGAMMVQGGMAGLAGAHATFGANAPRYRKGMIPELVERMKPARSGPILSDIPAAPAPGPRRQLTEGEPIINVEREPIRPQPFEPFEPAVQAETPLKSPLTRSREGGRSEEPVADVPRSTISEPTVEVEGPIEKTWLPAAPGELKPRALQPAEPYVEKLIREKEAAEEQRDTARRELEVDERTGYGSANALKRALPTAELDPETEIASLDLANLKARNDLDSPQAGDAEIKAAADAVNQAAKELGIPPRVFAPKGDEVYAIGPKGKMQDLVDRAVEIYGTRSIGQSEFSNYLRGGAGSTAAEADAAMSAMKAAEKGAKFRKVSPEGKPLFEDVSRVPLKDLDLEPERMQFKLAFGEGGQTGVLEGVDVWNPNLEGIILAWRDPADGRLKVVNGHNRVMKAKKLGVEDIPVKEIDAANALEARAAGALQNMAEGHGKPVDVGKFLRDTKTSPEHLKKVGIPLRSDMIEKGIALSRLNGDLFQRVVTGDMPVELGAIIGRKLDNPDLQAELVRMLKGKNLTNKVVAELADIVANAPRTQTTQASLFGDQEITESYAVHKARLLANIRTDISRDKTLFSKVAKHAERLGQQGIEIPVEESLNLSKEAAQALGIFDALKNKVGIIDDTLNEAAEKIGRGGNVSQVTAEATRRIKEALPGIVSGKAEAPRRPGEGRPAPAGRAETPAEPEVRAEAPAEVKPAEPAPKVEAEKPVRLKLKALELPDYAQSAIFYKELGRLTNARLPRPDTSEQIIEQFASEWERLTVPIESLRKGNETLWGGGEFVPRGSMTKGPIVLSREGEVIDGNNRLHEAIKAGEKTIEVFRPALTKERKLAEPKVESPTKKYGTREGQAGMFGEQPTEPGTSQEPQIALEAKSVAPNVAQEPKVTMEEVAKGMADAGAASKQAAIDELTRQGKGKNTRTMGDVKGPLFGNEEPKVQGGLFGEEKPEKPPSGEATAGGFRKGFEDAPTDKAYAGLDRVRVELPELVEIAQEINAGKLPGLRKEMGRALGRFRHRDVDPKSGDIQLRRDIFIGERIATKRSPHADDFDAFKQEVLNRSGLPEDALHFTKDYLKRKREYVFHAYRKDPTLAPKVMAHELGHLIDWVADSEDAATHQIMDRGNLLGRIASLHRQLKTTMMGSIGGPPEGSLGVITKQDRARIRKLAQDLLREDIETVIDEEIRTETPYKPEDILAIWKNTVASTESIDPKLYGYIARLDRAAKKQIVREAMKGKTPGPPGFPDFPQKTVSVKTGKKIVKQAKEGSPKEIAEKYRELIIAEIKKRQLLDAESVRDELKAVTQYWKPFNEHLVDPDYLKYRYSGKELYADAFSVLMNQPDKLKELAPNFWRGVFNYFERKPDVKASYDDVQARLGGSGGGTVPPRLGRIEDMFEEGRQRREDLNERRKSRVEDATNWLMRKLIDRGQGALKSIRKGEKQGGFMEAAAKEARYDLEEIQYLASEAGNYLEDIGSKILQPIRAAGLTPDQLGAYQFLTRIAEGERELMGNPLGYTEKTAKDTLEGMKTEMGAEKFKKLEEAAVEFQKLREELIIPRAEASGIYSPELIELMKDHKAYVRFGVSHWLDKTYGPGVSARVFKQVGTLSGIENPLVVTALQDLAVLRSAKINESKRSLIDHFRLNDPDAFEPAEMGWSSDVGARVPKEPANPRQALMTYLDGGKPVHVYVSKEIAKSYEAQPFEATKVAEILAKGMSGLRSVLVSKNPLWMARNVFRDIRQTYKNIPDIGALSPRDAARLAKAYNDAFKEAWRYVMRGQRSADIGEMQRGRMLVPGRVYEAREQSFENELERQAAEFLVDTGAVREATGARAKLRKFLEALDALGRVSEISGKIAGYKYLKPGWRDPKEIAHIIRTRVGTPDYKRQGEAQALTNNLFLFSNVIKEGWRSSWESFNEDRAGYSWKTIAANLLPKAALAAAAAGLAGAFYKRVMDGISEYDKSNYTIVPVGLTQEWKSIYFRIPEDYEGQYWGALGWKLAHGKVFGKGGAVNLTAEQVPWRPTNLNPFLSVGLDMLDYYGYGNNPTDEWRGRPVIREKAFEAGGAEAAKDLAKHAWRELGGTVVYDPARNELITTKGPIEEILRSFPGNILGTFLKISDRGIADRLRDVSQEVRKEKASGGIDVPKRIQQSINAAVKSKGAPDRGDMRQLYLELRRDGKISRETSETEFQNRYFRWAARVPRNPYVEGIVNAQSNAEKERLLMEYRKILSPAEYQEVLGELLRARTQSPKSLKNVERDSQREPQVQPGR